VSSEARSGDPSGSSTRPIPLAAKGPARPFQRGARKLAHVAAGLAIAFAVASTLPPPVAAGATPKLFGNWGGWTDGSRPTYLFSSSMPLTWMRNEAIAGINASGNTAYQNPVFRQITSGTPNVTVGMRATPSVCAGQVSDWYGCTDLNVAFSRWTVALSSSYCWMNGGVYRTCSNKKTFDVWSVIDHEFLHVNNLNHHFPVEGWNSVMDPVFPAYDAPFWQNRYPRGHDLSGLSTMYARDPCTTICPQSTGE
jgi:hypothetical protein